MVGWILIDGKIERSGSCSLFVLLFYPQPSFIRKMPLLVSALSALAVVSFALATPIWRTNQTFTIYEEVPKPFVPGPVRLLQTYRKYGIIPPPEALAAAAVASSSVTATPTQYDLYYLCPVTIGGQTLNLDFDTGSADL